VVMSFPVATVVTSLPTVPVAPVVTSSPTVPVAPVVTSSPSISGSSSRGHKRRKYKHKDELTDYFLIRI
jgi:hypothetical protein